MRPLKLLLIEAALTKRPIPAAKPRGGAAIRILPWRCGGSDMCPEQRTPVARCQQGERRCFGAPPCAQLPCNAEDVGERRPEWLDSSR